MKTLANLAAALIAASVFAVALMGLGVFCVLGAGMAAAACDLELTDEVASRLDPAEARALEPPRHGPVAVDPQPPFSTEYLAEEFALDTTVDSSPPGSVPVL